STLEDLLLLQRSTGAPQTQSPEADLPRGTREESNGIPRHSVTKRRCEKPLWEARASERAARAKTSTAALSPSRGQRAASKGRRAGAALRAGVLHRAQRDIRNQAILPRLRHYRG